jgi:hypothetical protein
MWHPTPCPYCFVTKSLCHLKKHIEQFQCRTLNTGLIQMWLDGRHLSFHPHAAETRELNIRWNLSEHSVELDNLFQWAQSIAFMTTDSGIWGNNTNSNVRNLNVVRELEKLNVNWHITLDTSKIHQYSDLSKSNLGSSVSTMYSHVRFFLILGFLEVFLEIARIIFSKLKQFLSWYISYSQPKYQSTWPELGSRFPVCTPLWRVEEQISVER